MPRRLMLAVLTLSLLLQGRMLAVPANRGIANRRGSNRNVASRTAGAAAVRRSGIPSVRLLDR